MANKTKDFGEYLNPEYLKEMWCKGATEASDRECDKCIYHIGGTCSQWECKGTTTISMVYECGFQDCLEEISKKQEEVVAHADCQEAYAEFYYAVMDFMNDNRKYEEVE